MPKEIKSMFHGGHVQETKQIERNGVPIGIVKGYIATWDVDRGDYSGIKDQFIPGAFLESLQQHKDDKNRQIRLKDHHGRTIGGFPIESVMEDGIGLFGVGEINLEVQQGKEAFSLAKQGVLADFSIGWSCLDFDMVDKVRRIKKAIIWEGSIVDEPMNPKADILEVKTVVPYQDLPLADRSRPWDSGQAVARIREFTDSEDEPSSNYKKAFLWYDSDTSGLFGSYKLPIADVIDGRLRAVPRAIFAAAAALRGARGGVGIPEGDHSPVIAHINHYYAKMGLDSPFHEQAGFRLDDFGSVEIRDLEKMMQSGFSVSRKMAKTLVSLIESSGLRDADEKAQRDAEDWGEVLSTVTQTKKIMEEKNA